MGLSLKVESHIDIPLHIRRIRDKTFWKFAANEWFRLITPFVPMQTGVLATTTNIKLPKGKKLSDSEVFSIGESSGNIRGESGCGYIVYRSPYAKRMYYNNYNFRIDKHSKAACKWDKAAAPTEKEKLIRAMQNYIDSGRLKL